MSAQSNAAPVIIKRKKVTGGDGHHGGAWKVAYADFVTAMMAFFLLMWLLNATTEKQRKGVADYFSPTVPIARISGGGSGAFGGHSIYSEDTLSQNSTGATNIHPTEANKARGEHGVSRQGADGKTDGKTSEDAALRTVKDALTGRGGESMVSDEAMKHIITRVTDQGLVIELFDLDDARLFAADTAEPTNILRELADMLARVLGLVENGIAIEGFTRARPIVLIDNPVWDLSTERAGATRLLLHTDKLGRDRVKRVTGHADKQPAVPDPMAIRNNRVEVILLREGQ
ncbi:flagellar motor protein MotB [Aquicoccus sp. G2-2]|uniref:flagellar motor protein MotB n=1 Tax=Aquicoccus sp. G2-2 TaxID=3092120 RepID=UPI002ADF49B1|nr:flagellar motor protein MotB [Aquicoccus sp. G2-2]MEA1114378.1 flagellar motor protein MotB [Aquicoccus sp. G2-2]